MNKKSNTPSSQISLTTLGLAIFSMLFGAGNIIYPIKAGVMAGDKNFFGIIGFLLTGAFLPLLGLVSMILFNGNLKHYFDRLGKIPGFVATLFCMFIIGPFIGMSRCITVPYDMISVFLPTSITLPIFSTFFCLITFLFTYKESRLLEVLGKFIGPVKIVTLSYIAIQGLWNAQYLTQAMPSKDSTPLDVFSEQFVHGFQTLDLLATIFFAYIIIKLLHARIPSEQMSQKQLAMISLKGGLIGSLLLTIMYVAYSYIGSYYGYLVQPSMNGAEIFRVISLNIVGQYGAFSIILAAMMACLSTASALAAVFSEYLKNDIFKQRLSYIPCLIITLLVTNTIANFGLTNILAYSGPFINMGYPIIITIAICNLAYKLFGFSWIKLPVAITTIAMVGLHIHPYITTIL